MPIHAPISTRQPQPFDIVDDPVDVCGIGTGFEGVFAARVRDGNGKEITLASVYAGGTGIWSNFRVSMSLGGATSTNVGFVEVFEFSARGDAGELNKVVIPISFGPALVDPYHGFEQYTVLPGDTLSKIAHKKYGDPNLWPRILDGNRDQIVNSNVVFPGQVLRIPM